MAADSSTEQSKKQSGVGGPASLWRSILQQKFPDIRLPSFIFEKNGVPEDSAPWCRLISQQEQDQSVSICTHLFYIGAEKTCNLVIKHPLPAIKICSILQCKQDDGSLVAMILCFLCDVQLNGKTMSSLEASLLNSGDELIFSCQRTYPYIFQLQGEVARNALDIENNCIYTDYSSHSVSSSNTLLSEAFDNFPYKLSDKTKYILVANACHYKKTLQNKKFTEKLSPSQRAKILLSGPAGSEMYQEKLCRALANFFRSKCLVFDSLSSPVLTTLKPKTKNQIASKTDSPSIVGELRKPSFRRGDRVVFTGLNIGSSCAMFSSSGPTFGSRGEIVLYFGNSYKIGVMFDIAIDQGIDLGGECEQGYGFFCYVEEVVLEPKDGDIVKLLSPILCEAIESGRMKSPLFLFIKDIKKFLEDSSSLNSPPKEDIYGRNVAISTKSVIDNLSKYAIVIGSHMNTDENKKVVTTPQPVADMFPCQIAIDMPEREEHFKELEHHFETEVQKIISVKNKKLLQNISKQRGVTFNYSEILCIADHVLTVKSAQNIIDGAFGYEMIHNADFSSKSEVHLSEKSISYGISTIRTEQTNLLEVLNDFEKKILEDSVLHGKFGVKFDDIGGYDELKDDLKTVVMHLLQRPKVSSKGLTAKGCKGILLLGPPGTGKTMLARALATEVRANFISFAIRNINPKWLGDHERYTNAVFSVAAGKLSPCVIFVDEADTIFARGAISEFERQKVIKEFISKWDDLGTKYNARVVVLLATNMPFNLDTTVLGKLHWRFLVKLPNVPDRTKILKVILANKNLSSDVDVDELANTTPRYSGSDLKNLCEFAVNRSRTEIIEPEKQSELKECGKVVLKRKAIEFRPLNRDDFIYAKTQTTASTSNEVISKLLLWNKKFCNSGSQMDILNFLKVKKLINIFEKRILEEPLIMSSQVGVKFDDIGAFDEVKDALKKLVVDPFKRPQLYSMGQFFKGILLFGPPGTGKSMLAKAVTTEAGANLITISETTLALLKGTNELIQHVKAIFSLASKIAPCIIFIDEVDVILGMRVNAEIELYRMLKNEIKSNWDCLVTNEKEMVIVVAATSRPFDLDDGVIRRLPRRLLVNLPDATSRSKILRVILAKGNVSPDLDFDELATLTPDYSGSDLKNLCTAAATENETEEKETELVEGKPIPVSVSNYGVRPLNMNDFRRAKGEVTPSWSADMSSQLFEWIQIYGEASSIEKVNQTYHF